MELLAEDILGSVAVLMDDADTMLEQAGFTIDESIEAPEDFIEALAQLLDENDLDEEVEELLCLNIALIEQYLDEKSRHAMNMKGWRRSQQANSPTAAKHMSRLGNELAGKEPKSLVKHAATWWPQTHRRSLEKSGRMGDKSKTGHKWGQKADPLASKEKNAMLKRYLDKKSKVSPIKPAPSAPAHKKSASNEDSELLAAVMGVVESAGYEIPGELTIGDFFEAAQALSESDNEVAEGMKAALTGAGISMLKSKAAARMARAGANAVTRKMNTVAK